MKKFTFISLCLVIPFFCKAADANADHLYNALQRSDLDEAGKLIEKGANPHEAGVLGQISQDYLAGEEVLPSVELLLKSGVDPYTTKAFGEEEKSVYNYFKNPDFHFSFQQEFEEEETKHYPDPARKKKLFNLFGQYYRPPGEYIKG